MTSNDRGLHSALDKSYVEQKEDVERGGRRRQSSTKHGDRALATIGDDRVPLTDEDVCFTIIIHLILGGAIHLLLVMLKVTKPYFY
jgi:hypothetical protein